MYGAANAASESFIFGRVETGSENLKGVELCKLETDFFCLSCDILY
jgi:hypothetical protein